MRTVPQWRFGLPSCSELLLEVWHLCHGGRSAVTGDIRRHLSRWVCSHHGYRGVVLVVRLRGRMGTASQDSAHRKALPVLSSQRLMSLRLGGLCVENTCARPPERNRRGARGIPTAQYPPRSLGGGQLWRPIKINRVFWLGLAFDIHVPPSIYVAFFY